MRDYDRVMNPDEGAKPCSHQQSCRCDTAGQLLQSNMQGELSPQRVSRRRTVLAIVQDA
jgi:hypothetical protein